MILNIWIFILLSFLNYFLKTSVDKSHSATPIRSLSPSTVYRTFDYSHSLTYNCRKERRRRALFQLSTISIFRHYLHSFLKGIAAHNTLSDSDLCEVTCQCCHRLQIKIPTTRGHRRAGRSSGAGSEGDKIDTSVKGAVNAVQEEFSHFFFTDDDADRKR